MQSLSIEKALEYSQTLDSEKYAFDCSPYFNKNNYIEHHPSQDKIFLNSEEEFIYTDLTLVSLYGYREQLKYLFQNSKEARVMIERQMKENMDKLKASSKHQSPYREDSWL